MKFFHFYMNQKFTLQRRFYFYCFLFVCIFLSILLSGCANTQQNLQSVAAQLPDISAPVVDVPSYVISFGQETPIAIDGVNYVVKINSAYSKDNSVVLSVKVGGGENVNKAVVNQVISFGNLRICISNITIDSSGNASAVIIPTTSQLASAWYSLATQDENSSCSLFSRAIFESTKINGATSFFSDAFSNLSSNDVIMRAYLVMLGQTPDNLSVQAWKFYIQQNGVSKFIQTLSESDEFRLREESIK